METKQSNFGVQNLMKAKQELIEKRKGLQILFAWNDYYSFIKRPDLVEKIQKEIVIYKEKNKLE